MNRDLFSFGLAFFCVFYSVGAQSAGFDHPHGQAPAQISTEASAQAPSFRAPVLGAPSFFGQPSDVTADWVLGQANFTVNTDTGAARTRIGYPMGAAHYVRGDSHYLFVVDQEYSRIQVFGNANNLTNGQPADTVIGQDSFDSEQTNKGLGTASAASFSYPSDIFADADGNLYVADFGNHRVLVFKDPIGTDFVADSVIGQGGSFTSRTSNLGGRGAASLSGPVSVAVDDQKNLYVADWGNHRVLIYFDPLNTDLVADRVLGQGNNFTSGTADLGGVSASSFDQPYRVRLDQSGNLYVTDFNNSRGLIFHSPVEEDGIADAVIGQPNFSTETANVGGLTAGIRQPCSLGVDAYANLYMADWGNTRVLYYKRPLAEDTLADVVFGQTDSTISLDVPPGAVSLSGAQRIDFDPDGNLYISDCYNSRLLKYRIAAVAGKCPVPWVTAPKTGTSVSGNAVSVIAHLAGSGKGVTIQFQYRKSPGSAWSVLGPDAPRRPYILKWNTTTASFSDGDSVWVRAAAMSADCDTTYSLPVRLVIKRSEAEVEENDGVDHEQKQKIEKGRKISVDVSERLKIDIPSAALDTDATLRTVDYAKNPVDKVPSDISKAKGLMYQKLEFENGPSTFRDSVTLGFQYSDSDNNGEIDGTDVPETSAAVFWMGNTDTEWKKLDAITLNTDSNLITAKISHFSYYAVFGSSSSSSSSVDAVALPKACLLTRFFPRRMIENPGALAADVRKCRDLALGFGWGRRILKFYYSL